MKSIYYKKSRWKVVLFLVAIAIGLISLLYTNMIVRDIEVQEREKIELWAKAQQEVVNNLSADADLTFIFDVIESNDDIPVILTDEIYQIESAINLDPERENDSIYLKSELETMRNQHQPIVNKYDSDEGSYQKYIFYKDSDLLYQLKYYPLYQLALITIFIIVAYLIFSLSRRYEQDFVWVGMAKETAHQLGTPISSLVAWNEFLEADGNVGPEILTEIKKDVTRLEIITERFSKIGSVPDLKGKNLAKVLENGISYMSARSSKNVKFEMDFPETEILVKINPPLFDWVIENLSKNALDAMGKEGKITISLKQKGNNAIIDFTDTGKGIASTAFKSVFQPGFSSKKRGWGLGLTLVKRIVENYHQGKIFVKNSSLGKGTTFRIVLPSI